mgnify:CR=1 FL=1
MKMIDKEEFRKIIKIAGLWPMKKDTLRKISKDNIKGCKNMKRHHDYYTYLMLLQMNFYYIYDDHDDSYIWRR